MKKEVGSICQRYLSGDPDPDPHQNFTDPQHWFIHNSGRVLPEEELWDPALLLEVLIQRDSAQLNLGPLHKNF